LFIFFEFELKKCEVIGEGKKLIKQNLENSFNVSMSLSYLPSFCTFKSTSRQPPHHTPLMLLGGDCGLISLRKGSRDIKGKSFAAGCTFRVQCKNLQFICLCVLGFAYAYKGP
jgi:hypothetical protein